MRPAPRLAGLSPRRRALITAVALVVVALAVAGGIGLSHSGSAAAPQDPSASRPGYVLLVPGYGGSTSALAQLAVRIRPPAGPLRWCRWPGMAPATSTSRRAC